MKKPVKTIILILFILTYLSYAQDIIEVDYSWTVEKVFYNSLTKYDVTEEIFKGIKSSNGKNVLYETIYNLEREGIKNADFSSESYVHPFKTWDYVYNVTKDKTNVITFRLTYDEEAYGIVSLRLYNSNNVQEGSEIVIAETERFDLDILEENPDIKKELLIDKVQIYKIPIKMKYKQDGKEKEVIINALYLDHYGKLIVPKNINEPDGELTYIGLPGIDADFRVVETINEYKGYNIDFTNWFGIDILYFKDKKGADPIYPTPEKIKHMREIRMKFYNAKENNTSKEELFRMFNEYVLSHNEEDGVRFYYGSLYYKLGVDEEGNIYLDKDIIGDTKTKIKEYTHKEKKKN